MDENMKKTKVGLLIITLVLVISLIIGGTFAYWRWNSNNISTVSLTTSLGSMGLTFDGGGNTTVNKLAPASCTHPTYSAMIPLSIDRYNETTYPAKTTLSLKLISFTWSHAKPTSTDLSNVKFAVTNSNNSCLNPIISGDLSTVVMNNSGNTAQSQNVILSQWEYVLPQNSGTQSSNIHEDYYLYVWIDKDYTVTNYGSNQVQDPLQDISFTLTWTASQIEQFELPPLKPGDYVSYTPSKSTYSVDTSMTGYTGNDQSNITPSELTLWRVLKVKPNGTVEIISENVSSTGVYFEGKTGFKNYVGYLNVLASQYETAGITVGSRHFGYNGQTEYITDETYFTYPAPWTCSTRGTCSPDPDDYEDYGGGDSVLFIDDYNLINTVLGATATKKQGTSINTGYWAASRQYNYMSGTYYGWFAYSLSDAVSSNLFYYYKSDWGDYNYNYSIRPIVILKSGLSYTGDGSSGSPWAID